MIRALPLLLLAGCVIGNEKYPRPRDLADFWQVDRTRILAIRAEPPEVRPGQHATFEALVPTPDGSPRTQLWTACPVDLDNPDATSFGCSFDPEAIDEDTLPELSANCDGLIGISGFAPPQCTPDTDFLLGLEEEERAEGGYVLVTVMAVPTDLELAPADRNRQDAPADIDFSQIEVGYKRLVVSEAATPNHNPEIEAFRIDGTWVPEHSVVEVDANAQYQLGVNITAASVETYTFVNSDGEEETRVEELFTSFLTTAGEQVEPWALYGEGQYFADGAWTSPTRAECRNRRRLEVGEALAGDDREAPCEGTWYAIVRDRRGGMSWTSRRWRLRQ